MLGEHDTIGRLQAELQDLSDTIQHTLREVATIRHPMMENDRVQSAVDELGAIVAATELATGQILTAAETIETAIGEADAEMATEAVTSIYEACNFQDITGQRITRVMSLLRDVDERLLAIIEHVGQDRFISAAPPPARKAPQGDEALLNGPAPAGAGLQQDSIDSLFA